ncbi:MULTISPECIES: hypothetical protein [unclassified Paenibacillus]|uniref:hypothetical protein n=1 Tax=unclassified Paenibacillus TaxID=185978 RepID=UPI0004671D43|nr:MULTISPECIES: hypothetical protein [unclassified Paenibacillus]KGP82121.1 hypothetical protein P364_0113785 [Paenibacillus sp. MAEPY2]KGP84774.1 hypothetical protein P363_0123045 [Paenibacillus sp. MAEPY1]
MYGQQMSFNASAKHIIVKLDVPWYTYRELQDYSFVFSIYPEKKPNKDCSFVDIKVVHDSKLRAMNKDVFKLDKYMLRDESLVINEVIEIVKEETKFQTQYVAILRNQVTLLDCKWIGTRNVLLLINHLDGERLSAKYSTYYAKEFEASIVWQEAEMDYYRYLEVYTSILDSPVGEEFKKIVDEKRLKMKAKWGLYLDAVKR